MAATGGEDKGLESERSHTSFPVHELEEWLAGGKSLLELRKRVALEMERDPAFKLHDMVDLSRPEQRKRSARAVARLAELYRGDDETTAKVRDMVAALVCGSAHSRISNHRSLFEPAVRGLGSEEQVAAWDKRMRDVEMLGCFCMTEVGHGSYVRGLETTATSDESTDEFVVHSPTPTSGKCWIGSAGKSATHAVVYAQLVVDGVCHGPNAFLVPLRHMDTGATMPGVTAWDMGAKMGRNGLDNGLVYFSHVRIPRANLLCRFVQVSRQGKVTQSPLAQLAYGALVGGRIVMVHGAGMALAAAATIATRYMAVRRQFGQRGKAGERKVLDYPVQQYRALDAVASSMAITAAARALDALHATVQQDLQQLQFESLKTLHANSACLKADTTWTAYRGIDTCRQCCGGHGYSAYSGLPSLLADFAVMCTWEGDNTVLCLQTARWLLKGFTKVKAGRVEAVPQSLQYLQMATSSTTLPTLLAASGAARSDSSSGGRGCDDEVKDDESSVESCVGTVEWLAAVQVAHLAKEVAAVDDSRDALNVAGVAAVAAARAHAVALQARAFATALQTAPAHTPLSTPTVSVLRRLCKLYCLNRIQDSLAVVAAAVTADGVARVRHTIARLVAQLRPDAVALVDAFGFSDFCLNSPLGRYDGDVYTHYLAAIQSAPAASGVPREWRRWFPTMFARGRAKM